MFVDLQKLIEMLSTDLIAELRAEVTRWWHQLQRQQQQKLKDLAQQPSASSSKSASVFFNTPILGAMLGDTPLRMIASGQELTPDCDERTLAEMQIKDHQVRTACLCDDPCCCACLAIILFFCPCRLCSFSTVRRTATIASSTS